MMLMKVFINLFAAIVEIIVVKELYSMFGEKGKHFTVIFCSFLVAYIGFAILATLYVINGLLMIAVNFIIFGLFSFAYNIKFQKVILSLLIYFVIAMLLEFVVGLVISVINGITPEQFSQDMSLYLQGVLIAKITTYLCIKAITSVFKKNHGNVFSKASIMFLAIPATTIATLYVLSLLIFQVTNSYYTNLIIIVSCLLCAANIATLQIYDFLTKQLALKQKVELQSAMLEKEVKNYDEVINMAIASSKYNHDINHKLYAISELVKNGDVRGINQIDEMCSLLNKNKIVEYTRINSVDALINIKRQKMIDKNIDTKIEVFLSEKISVLPVDLCIVLGNLLDNAFEACLKVEDIAKNVLLNITQQNNYLTIKVENSAHKEVAKSKTSKQNKISHGYGLQNVEDIANKYDGNLSVVDGDSAFTAIVMLKM